MVWQTFPVKGWAPDLSPNAPGYLTDTQYVLPTDRGLSHAHYPAALTLTTGGTPYGGVVVQKIDGTERVFGGTATKIYEYDSTAGTYIDRAGSAYAATAADTWDFTQLGDVTLAVNKQNIVQTISSGATFADATTNAPKGSIICTVGPPASSFAMVFDYNDGSNNYQDGWFCGAIGSVTDWTPSIATQCANGRLLDINGKITAAQPWRDGVLVWKKDAMYSGTYVGAPDIWSWRRVATDVGCIGKNAVCAAGDVVYWADRQGLWMYDGSYPRRIPGFVQNWWAARVQTLVGLKSSGPHYPNYISATYNKALGVVLFSLPDNNTNKYRASHVIAYHVRSGIWTQIAPFTGWTNAAANVYLDTIIGTVGEGRNLYTWDGSFGNLTYTTGTSTPSSLVSSSIVGEHGKVANLKGVALSRVPFYVSTFTQPSDAVFAAGLSATVYHGPAMPLVNTTSAPYSASFTVNTVGNNVAQLDGIATNKYVRPAVTIATGGMTAQTYWEVDAISVDVSLSGAQ